MTLRRILAPIAGATLALAAAAPAAPAAPPWSAPAAVPSPAGEDAGAPRLALAAGTGVLGWSAGPDLMRLGAPATGRLAGLRDGVPSGPVRTLAPYDLAADPAVYGRTRTLVLQRRPLGTDTRLAVAFGRTDGALGARRVLAARTRIADADLAVNARGDAVVAWVEDRPDERRRVRDDRLWVALKRAGGAFARPAVLVGSGSIEQVDVAVGARGDVQVALTRRAVVESGRRLGERRVHVRFRAAGRAFGPLQAVGEQFGFVEFAGAVTPAGRAYLAWGTQDIGEEADEPFRVLATTKPAGSGTYRAADVVDPGGDDERPVGRVALALGPDEQATLAWSGVAVDRSAGFALRYPVRTAASVPGGTFGPPADLPGADGGVAGVVTGADGTTTVAWAQLGADPAAPRGLRAAVRPAGAAAFGATEVVSDEPVDPNAVAALGLDPAGERPVAAWVGPGGDPVRISRREG